MPATVPCTIQEIFPSYAGLAWYWKAFEAPKNPHPGGRYLLRFWMVDYKADVWVNGKLVGSHEVADEPFVLDATEAVRAGANVLAVRVLHPTLSVRIVEIRVQQPGFRVQKYVLSTTLLDPQEWPVERLGELYFRRWSVELFFRDIKITMGMDILRCQTPEMVRKKIIMHAIAYNCIRGLMQHAAALYDVPFERISFKGTSDSLRQWADAFNIHAGKPRKQYQMLEALLAIIAEDALPYRPNRSEPRAKKRRPKAYQLMTKPRHEMVVSDSRRKW